MSILFNASDILEAAIRIEENGEVFYREAARKTKDEEIRKMFEFLANEEVKHRRIFSELLSQTDEPKTSETYPDEYMEYLKVFADQHVFNKENAGLFKVKLIKTPKQAVKIALKAELDSILFYLEAKNLIPSGSFEAVDKIVEEERRHYLRLLKIQGEMKKRKNDL